MAKKKNEDEDDDVESGIDAITSDTPTPPYAVPQLTRGSDGLNHTVYVDPETGETISDLKGYTVIEGNNYYKVTDSDDLNDDGKVDTTETKVKTDAASNHSSALDGGGTAPSLKSTASASTNFGYASKPTAVKMASMLPGALGLAGKAVNFGWNLNNQSAVESARDMLGLPNSLGKTLKGSLKDNKGQVSNDAQINGKNYSIGFEALSPTGLTNLTPTEANTRASMFGATTEDPSVANRTSGVEQKSTSRFSQITGIQPGFAKRALDKVFGIKEPVTTETKTATPSVPEQSKLSQITGIQPGFATRALDKVFGITEPAKEGVANAETAATKAVTPGVGLANLTPQSGPEKTTTYGTGVAQANFDNIGPNRNTPPSDAITSAIGTAVANVLGPNASFNVTSGTYSKEKQDTINAARAKAEAAGLSPAQVNAAGKAAGQYGSVRHTTGLAADFSAVDPATGKPATSEQMQDIAANFAYSNPDAGVGIGLGYMDEDGTSKAHLDLTGLAGQWGALGKTKNMSTAMAQTLDAAREGYMPTPFSTPPTPTDRPDPSSLPTSFVSQDERPSVTPSSLDPVGNSLNPTAAVSLMNTTAPQNAAQAVTAASLSKTLGKNYNSVAQTQGLTPAKMATMGLVARTPAQKSQIATAIAGELSPASLKGLSENDPVARAEFANIAASIENRAQSYMTPSLAKTLTPTSYNSLMTANLPTTQNNYNTYATSLNAALNDFYSGNLQPTNFSASNYFNPDSAAPAWGDLMSDQQQVGAHLFGTLPEYAPTADAVAAMNSYAMSDLSNFPGKAADDMGIGAPTSGLGGGYSPSTGNTTGYGGGIGGGNSGGYSIGGGYSTSTGSGSAPGGTPGQSGGAGYSPGGMNSPSGSSYGGYGGGNTKGYGGPTGVSHAQPGASANPAGGYASTAPSGATGGL